MSCFLHKKILCIFSKLETKRSTNSNRRSARVFPNNYVLIESIWFTNYWKWTIWLNKQTFILETRNQKFLCIFTMSLLGWRFLSPRWTIYLLITKVLGTSSWDSCNWDVVWSNKDCYSISADDSVINSPNG